MRSGKRCRRCCTDPLHADHALGVALELLDDMSLIDLVPTAACYSAAAAAAARGGDCDAVLRILDDMLADGLDPTLKAYNAAIKACADAGKWRQAVQVRSKGALRASERASDAERS